MYILQLSLLLQLIGTSDMLVVVGELVVTVVVWNMSRCIPAKMWS